MSVTPLSLVPAPRARIAQVAPPPSELPAARESGKWITSLTYEGRYWLLAFVGLWLTGWVKGINLILLLSYLMLFLWVLNWYVSRRSLRGLRADRRLGDEVFAGTPALWQAEVRNDSQRPQNGWWLVDEGPDHSVKWFIAHLEPGERIRLRRDVVLRRRGHYVCQPIKATSSFPFGLVNHTVEFGTGQQVMVLPQLGSLNVSRLRRWLTQTARPDERTRRSRRTLAHEVEFQGLRAFHPGDSPRWIHWRTSARRNELMVREFDQGTHHDLLLIVEPFLSGQTNATAALEAAISLTATICWTWTYESDDRIVLAVAGAEPAVIPGHAGAGVAFEYLEALADVRGTSQPNLAGLEKRLSHEVLPRGPALLVSSRAGDARSAEDLARRLDRPVAYLDATAPPSFYQPPAMPSQS